MSLNQRIILRTSHDNPDILVRHRGLWQIDVDGERWFGPDTLAACLDAKPTIIEAVSTLPQGEQPCRSQESTHPNASA